MREAVADAMGRRAPVLWALVLVGFLVAGQILPTFYVGILIAVFTLALFGMGYNLLFGYTGLLSFGHAAYYGTAIYAMAILISGLDGTIPGIFQNYYVAFVTSVLIAALFAAVFGALCVQRGEISFAMLTLAFGMMLYPLARQWEWLTGGSDGTILQPPVLDLGVVSLNLGNTNDYYYVVLAIGVVTILALYRLVNSPYGELLKVVRENPERAEFIGINVKLYQWSAFVLSGVVAGIAGVLTSVRVFVVTPEFLHWSTGAEPLLATLIGGPSTFLGPIIGAFVFVGLEEILVQFTQHWQVGLGLLLIPIVLFMPGGIGGYISDADRTPATTALRALGVGGDDVEREDDAGAVHSEEDQNR